MIGPSSRFPLQDSPVVIYPVLKLVKVSALVVGVEVRSSARWPPEAYEQRRHVAPALQRDAERLDAMVDVHSVLERVVRKSVGNPGVLVYLPPGVHPDHVLQMNQRD